MRRSCHANTPTSCAQADARSARSTTTFYALKGFIHFLDPRTLREATAEDILAYQVEIAARGKSDSSVRVATYALRGFFHKILDRADWNFARLPKPPRPKRLPEILSTEMPEDPIYRGLGAPSAAFWCGA